MPDHDILLKHVPDGNNWENAENYMKYHIELVYCRHNGQSIGKRQLYRTCQTKNIINYVFREWLEILFLVGFV